jgi:translation initiation factor 3 subunit D
MGDNVKLLARTEVEATTKGKQDEDLFISVHALNETDPKVFSTIDWRQKLETQRGAVLATELKNNSFKLAKWTLQSLLAGADLLKLGYVSRVHAKNAERHVILGTQTYKPKEFATQVNLNVPNAWAILKAVVDMCLKLPEGKYLLLKDPNKPVLRVYDVGEAGLDDDDDDDDDEMGEGMDEEDD